MYSSILYTQLIYIYIYMHTYIFKRTKNKTRMPDCRAYFLIKYLYIVLAVNLLRNEREKTKKKRC